MQRLFAIAWLTWKAAFRFRLFIVLAAMLVVAVVGLPVLIKDDGTARGFTQILLTYTLSAITALLGLSTLWLACGTLARDIEECQMQVVAVKPIARWQIWLGKWLGIVSLDALLLALSGACVFGMLQWRAGRLPPKEQEVLRNEVLVARGSARMKSRDAEIQATAQQELEARLKETRVTTADLPEVRKQILEQVKAEHQIVPPGYYREWNIDLGAEKDSLRDKPIYLRIKFNTGNQNSSGTYGGLWYVGDPPQTPLWRSEVMSLAADTFHEFEIGTNLFDTNGLLTVKFVNMNETALLFPLEDGFEVLYRQGGFTANFIRGLGIILCWMALFAAIGLAAASFLSFPVAAFLSFSLLAITMATGTLSGAVEQGTIGGWDAEKGTVAHTPVDFIVIPTFRGILRVIGMAKDYSPIDSLSSGRSITWTQLGTAFGEIVLLISGALAVAGIIIFTRRELATAQGTQ